MYPITYDADYEVERNRLTTFFRLLIVLPWALWASIYGIAAFVVVIIAWFAMLFTKRFPEGMYNFVAGYLRLQGRVHAYAALLTDELPSFSGKPEPDYPVRVDVGPPQPEYRRSRTFFKYLLYFPQYLLVFALAYLLQFAALISWFRIMVTGKQSITMHDALLVSTAYVYRSAGYLLMLTEAHPRLLEVTAAQPPPGAPGMLYSGEHPELLPPGTAVATSAPPPPEPPPPAPPATEPPAAPPTA